MKKYLTQNICCGSLFAGIVFSPLTAFAADFVWQSSGVSSFTTASNWANNQNPSNSSSASTNDIVTPEAYGDVFINIGTSSTSYIRNFNVSLTSDWTWRAPSSGAGTLAITGTLTKAGESTSLTFRNGNSGEEVGLAINNIDVQAGVLNLGGTSFNNRLSNLTVSGTTTVGTGATLNVHAPTGTFGAVVMNGGTFNINEANGSDIRTLRVASLSGASGSIRARTNGTSPAVATLIIQGGAGSTTYAGTLSNGSATATLALGKTGAATQILSGANTYSGGTTITGGALLANNTTGSAFGTGSVTLNSADAILGGTGIIAPDGNNIVLTAGTLAVGEIADTAGSGIVTLTFRNSGSTVNFSAGAPVDLRLDLWSLTDHEQFVFDGISAINLDGATLRLDIGNFTGAWAAGQSFRLFDWGGTSVVGTLGLGSLPALGGGLEWDVSQLYTDGIISVVAAIPEPSATVLITGAGIAAFALIGRRRHAR